MNKVSAFFKFVIEKLKRSINRFPITMGMTAVFVVNAIILTHQSYNSVNRDLYERILFAVAVAIPLTAAGKLLIEKLKLEGLQKLLVNAGSLVLPLAYYFSIPKDYNEYFVMRFFALWAILYLVFLMVPYFYKRSGFSRYVLFLFGRFFLTVLYSGVLFAGLAMMVFTIEELFGVSWWDEVYLDVFIIIAGAFGVTHFLGSVPEIQTDVALSAFSKVFRGMFLFIILPIVGVYTLILYAYFIKILFNFELPEGVIGNLVLWYAMVSVATLFFIRDLRDEIPWLNKFYKLYIPAMVVPLAMLFVAIFIRIDAYGMTMPRYFVVALAVFSTMSLAGMWAIKKDTAVLTVSLLIVFIGVSFFGVFSGYNMTRIGQTRILERLLADNAMLSNGTLIANPSLSLDRQREISEQINFLLNNFDVKEIETLPSDFDREKAKEVLGFELTNYWGGPIDKTQYFNYYDKEPNRVVPLSGADYLLMVNSYETREKLGIDASGNYFIDKAKPNILNIYEGDTPILTIDLNEGAKRFYLNQDNRPTFESEDGKMKIILDYINISGRVVGDRLPVSEDDLSIDHYDLRILIDLEESF